MWRSVFLKLSGNGPIRTVATRTAIGRQVASRFVAGETVDQAVAACRGLVSRGLSTQLDYLGENVHDQRQAAESVETYQRLLRTIKAEGLESHVSLKLTQMGLELGEATCMENVDQVVSLASELGTFVWLDMEGSDYTDRTLRAYEGLRHRHENVGVALQAALKRSEEDLKRVLSAGGVVRLCKGAYVEPPEIAHTRKKDVDRAFARMAEALVAGRNCQAIATHDERMIRHVARFARTARVDRQEFEFQMLYGVRRDLQAILARSGFRVRVYVPFGREWYPYLMRRLAERPANLLFVVSNVAREGSARVA